MRSLILAALLCVPVTAGAVDNSKRLFGLGFSTHVRPTLSFKWIPSQKVELVYLVGANIAKAGRTRVPAVTLGNKLQYVIVAEENMNLYGALGVMFSFGNNVDFVFDYFAGPGVELFFPDFKNLGFFAEFGIGGNHKGAPYLATFADPTFGAGLHYYF